MSGNDTFNISGNIGAGVVQGDLDQSRANLGGTSNTIQISAETLQIHLTALEKALEQANADSARKTEALGLLKQLMRHPLVAAVIGGAAGSSLSIG